MTNSESRTATASHTPGPWRACQDGNCSCGTIFGSDGNTTIGRAYGESDLELADQVPAHEMQQANTRLIAAAPDMLAALATVTMWNAGELEDNDWEKVLRKVRAAIAKATGGTVTEQADAQKAAGACHEQ